MKTDKITELSVNKSKKRKKEVIDSINRMTKRGDKINFYSVMKETKASKSYLYNNKEIRELIEEYRGTNVKPRSVKGNKVIIEAQQKKIKESEKAIEKLEDDNADSYKQKYEKLLQENRALKQQLRNSTYTYS